MGWPSSADTLAQVRLEFPSREAAIVYAHQNGIAATVAAPHRPKPIVRSYASNFIEKLKADLWRCAVPITEREIRRRLKSFDAQAQREILGESAASS